MPKTRPIRVLFVNDHLGLPGGVVHGGTTYLRNTLPNFDRERVEPYLGILKEYHPAARDLEDLGVPVTFYFRRKWDPRAVVDIVRTVRKLRIDVLHVNGQKSHVLGRLAGLVTGVPVIVHLHFQYRPRPRSLNSWLAKRTALCLTVSDVLREHAIEHFVMPRNRTRTLYNGVDVSSFARSSPEAGREIREELGLSDAAKVLTVVGRIMPEGSRADKGQVAAIRSLQVLSGGAEFVLLVVGDGPGRQECEALADELGVGDRVYFLGQRDDVPAIYRATDLALAPSNNPEAFGYAALEAMATGIPIIASDRGGFPEALGEGSRGVLVPAQDPVAIADAATGLISDPDRARRLVAEGREFVSALTVKSHVRALEDVYEAIVPNGSRAELVRSS